VAQQVGLAAAGGRHDEVAVGRTRVQGGVEKLVQIVLDGAVHIEGRIVAGRRRSINPRSRKRVRYGGRLEEVSPETAAISAGVWLLVATARSTASYVRVSRTKSLIKTAGSPRNIPPAGRGGAVCWR